MRETPGFAEYEAHVERLKMIDSDRHVALGILMVDDPEEANEILIAERNTIGISLEFARRLLTKKPPNVEGALMAIGQAMGITLDGKLPSQSERDALVDALTNATPSAT